MLIRPYTDQDQAGVRWLLDQSWPDHQAVEHLCGADLFARLFNPRPDELYRVQIGTLGLEGGNRPPLRCNDTRVPGVILYKV